jgi:hypothetical protein
MKIHLVELKILISFILLIKYLGLKYKTPNIGIHKNKAEIIPVDLLT